jgi:hypothetical protein
MSYVPLTIQAINHTDKVIHLNRRDPSPSELHSALLDYFMFAGVRDPQAYIEFEMWDDGLKDGWTCRA